MRCPKCGNNSCNIVSEKYTTGKDYSICLGICGELLFGSYSSLCGWTEGKEVHVDVYWECKKCHYKFKA